MEELSSVAQRRMFFELPNQIRVPPAPHNSCNFRQPLRKVEARNWLLKDRGPALPTAKLHLSNVDMRWAGLEPPRSSKYSTFQPHKLTQGRLGLTKSRSLLDVLNSTDPLNRPLQRYPQRKSVLGVFKCDNKCCCCSNKKKTSRTPSPNSDSESFSSSASSKLGSCPELERPFLHKIERNWEKKRIEEWNLDDILSWLQALGQDELASLLIGYEICGKDVNNWNSAALDALGIAEVETQNFLLTQLDLLRSSRSKETLFEWVRRSGFSQILALDVSLEGVDCSRGPRGEWKVLRAPLDGPLKAGDCIIEMNGEHPASRLAESGKVVVLRRGEIIRL